MTAFVAFPVILIVLKLGHLVICDKWVDESNYLGSKCFFTTKVSTCPRLGVSDHVFAVMQGLVISLKL